MVLICVRGTRKHEIRVMAADCHADVDWRMLGSLPNGDTVCDVIQEWVRTSNSGRRTSHNIWQMDSESAVTAFFLRWDGQSVG